MLQVQRLRCPVFLRNVKYTTGLKSDAKTSFSLCFFLLSSYYILLILFTIAHRGLFLHLIVPFGVKIIDLYFIISWLSGSTESNSAKFYYLCSLMALIKKNKIKKKRQTKIRNSFIADNSNLQPQFPPDISVILFQQTSLCPSHCHSIRMMCTRRTKISIK